MKVAYLVNQYPKVSHSFIRREIVGLEAQGIEVARFSIRSCEGELVDSADKQELDKTRYVLASGAKQLMGGTLGVLFSSPVSFFRVLGLTLQIGWGSERGVFIHLAYFIEACALLGWFREAKVEHLHVHFGTNSATVAMLCRALGSPPYSFTVHGPEEFDKAQAISLPEKIERAAFVIAITFFCKSQLFRWCNYQQWEKIHIVHCGLDELFLEQTFVPLPDVPRLVCVGRLSAQKGHFLLIEAISQLAAAGKECELVLVGDGELRPQLETLIEQLGLTERVKITGWATNTEVRQYILASQLMVLPSFAEGLPVVLMEALAVARPAVSTYIAGIPELVVPGESGWLVPSGSVEALTAALREALATPKEKLEQMGLAGAEIVREQHSIKHEAAKLAALFRSQRWQ